MEKNCERGCRLEKNDAVPLSSQLIVYRVRICLAAADMLKLMDKQHHPPCMLGSVLFQNRFELIFVNRLCFPI